ncbi:MAG TPA: hypothetical protein VFK13_10940 [Gemmatimonadaceae bacterium]|nr:hypothetical protein [Gemmatimonadaceae bacterium]
MRDAVRRVMTAAVIAVTCAGAGAAAACTDVVTDPSVPFSIELRDPQLPSVVVGDSMRDTLGVAVPLDARVFNAQNDLIPDAPVTFLPVSGTGQIILGGTTGIVVGVDTGTVAVIAQSGSLQSQRVTLHIVPVPDTIIATDDPRKSLDVLIGQDNAVALPVQVLHDPTPTVANDPLTAVPDFLVTYAIVDPSGLSPTDTTVVHLINDAQRVSTRDTTDTQGTASRSLRVGRAIRAPIPDSVVIEASARLPNGTPVAGSPVRFVVTINAP